VGAQAINASFLSAANRRPILARSRCLLVAGCMDLWQYPCTAAEHAGCPILRILADSVRSRGGQWEYGLVISSAVVTVLQPAHVTNMHQNLAYGSRYINKPSELKWQLSGAGVGQKAATLLLRYQKT